MPMPSRCLTPAIAAVATAAVLACTGASAQFVEHDKVRCAPVPKEEKRGQMELQRKLVAEGWRVRQVKDFNGCYEVYGAGASAVGRRCPPTHRVAVGPAA